MQVKREHVHCARCHKVAGNDQCPGNSNAKLCEDNGDVKVKVADVWKDILDSVNYMEWNGGEIEDIENEKEEELEEDDANISNCDGFVISNLEENSTTEDIKAIIKGSVPDEALQVITVHPTGSTRNKIIKDIEISLVKTITRKIDNKSFKGRLLHCRPHVPITPPKPAKDGNKHDINKDRP